MTRIGRFVVFALASMALAAGGSARNPDATRLSRVETYLRERYPDSVPGIVVGIVSAGRLVHVSAHGLADVEARVPMSRGTRFNVMSLAKQFTAAAVGLLVVRGELSLNDDVHRYVPELPDYGVPIRIRDLVHHTSGLRDVHTLWILAGGSPEDARGRTAHLAMLSRQRGLNFTPGTEYLYSNSGYILLALVVERVSGLSFPEYARRNLFAPLGMKDSEFAVPEPGDDAHAAPSYRRDSTGVWTRLVSRDRRTGASDLVTTIPDLARWVADFDERRVGGARLAALMETRGVLADGDTTEYAFGNIVDRHEGFREIMHSGGLLGMRCKISRFPEQQLALIYCGNGTPAHNDDVYAIANILLLEAGLPAQRPPASPGRRPDAGGKSVRVDISELLGLYRSEELASDLLVEPDGDGLRVRADRAILAHGTVAEGDSVLRAKHPELGRLDFQFVRAVAEQPMRVVVSTERVRGLAFSKIP